MRRRLLSAALAGALVGGSLVAMVRDRAAKASGFEALQFSGRDPTRFWLFDTATGWVYSCRIDGDRMCVKEGGVAKLGAPLARP